MTDDVASIFHAQAAAYDGLRRQLIPPFDALYTTAVDALTFAGDAPRRILDLGAGTGLLSALVRRTNPGAKLVLLDGAPAMLERARDVVGEPATFCVGDLRDALPSGPFDAVVSALAIHHLDDAAKRALFARAHSVLAPNGVFVNAEQVAAPTETLEQRYRAWHQQSSLELGATPADWLAAEQRMQLDRCSSIDEQTSWLKDAGFVDVDCLFKHYRFAVLFARRAALGYSVAAAPAT